MRWRVAGLVGLGLIQGLGLGWLMAPLPATATSSAVYISELQTSGAGSGQSNYEFVELYNASASDVALGGWALEYRSASASNGADCSKGWKSAALPSGVVKSHGFFLLADKSYPIVADGRFSLDLAATAGTIHILDTNKVIADSLAWGDGTPCGAGDSAAMVAGQSLERLPGVAVPLGGNGYNTGNNQSDFALRIVPEPQSSVSPLEQPLTFTDVTQGDSSGQLRLSEVFGGGTGQPAFVEFHNTGSTALALGSYTLRVGSASYYLPQRVVLPGGYAMVAGDTFPLTLPAGSGEVDLVDAAGDETDGVSWSNAAAGASLMLGDDGSWVWTATPTPGAANRLTALPVVPSPGVGAGGVDPGELTDLTVYPALDITELLPDPVAPASDATDEFIELYNPNGYDVDVAGYSLKTGTTLSSHYTLPDLVVPAGGYVAFTSAQTHVALSNSGSEVGLFDPLGGQVGETVAYGTAKSGEAWAKFGSGWAWTTTPTPAAPNILIEPAGGAVAGAHTSVVPKASKKAAAAKLAKPKAVKALKATKSSAVKVKAAVAKIPALAAAAGGGLWLLFGLVGLTICYCGYEFRYDLRGYYYRLRGYPGRGRQTGAAAAGQRDDRVGQRSGRRQDDVHAGAGARARVS